MFRDLLSDALTSIRNGVAVGKKSVCIRTNGVMDCVLRVLLDGGFIKNYDVREDEKKNKVANVELKYCPNSAIKEIKQISKQSSKVYSKSADIPCLYNGLGVVVVSTSHGIMSGRKAKQMKLGGELICRIL